MSNISFSHSQYAAPAEYSELLTERKDCVVRALAVAGKLTYARAHELLAEAGRKNGCGTPHSSIQQAVAQLFPGAVKIRAPNRSCPLAQMLLFGYFDKGSYLVITTRHALAVVDGTVHDWKLQEKFRVRYYYQLS
jgi:hypothetical protein